GRAPPEKGERRTAGEGAGADPRENRGDGVKGAIGVEAGGRGKVGRAGLHRQRDDAAFRVRLAGRMRCVENVDVIYASGSSSSGRATARATFSVRRRAEMRSALSKVSSRRNRRSGANFRFTLRATSCRRALPLRESAATTASSSRAPSGIT